MGSRNVIVYLIIGTLSVVLGYDIFLQHQTQLVTAKYYRAVIDQQEISIKNHQESEKFVKENIEDIYKLSVLDPNLYFVFPIDKFKLCIGLDFAYP